MNRSPEEYRADECNASVLLEYLHPVAGGFFTLILKRSLDQILG